MSMQWRIETYTLLPSTQTLLKARAEAGEKEGLVIRAHTQSKGYGQRGHVWCSPPGNIYFSALLRPCNLPAQKGGEIALMAAVSLARAIPQGHLKWPNDVLIKGKKCAGVLIETGLIGQKINWVALGIGVNVTAPPIGTAATPKTTFDSLLENLARCYTLWQKEGFGLIRAEWLERSVHTLGTPLTSTENEGIFEGLAEDGSLLLSGRKITKADIGHSPKIPSCPSVRMREIS